MSLNYVEIRVLFLSDLSAGAGTQTPAGDQDQASIRWVGITPERAGCGLPLLAAASDFPAQPSSHASTANQVQARTRACLVLVPVGSGRFRLYPYVSICISIYVLSAVESSGKVKRM